MKTLIIVDNRVRVPIAGLAGHVIQELKDSFRHENPEWLKKKRMNLPTYGEPRTYVTWKDEGGGVLSFPRGGFARVRTVLEMANVECSFKDKRTTGVSFGSLVTGKEPKEIPKHLYTLYTHQEEALAAAHKTQNCVVRAPTGSGKTTVGFALASAIQLPTLVIVWAGALFTQWQKRAVTELGYKPSQVGVVRGGKFKLKPLTIAMQQSIAKVFERGGDEAEELRAFPGAVICDEVQRFAAPTLFAAVDPFPAKYRIGISADETRKDRKEFLIYDLFGQVAADIPRSRLVKEGHVLDVEIRVVPTKFDSRIRGDFNALLEEMINDEARNHLVEVIVEGETKRSEQVVALTHRREHAIAMDASFARMGLKSGIMLGGVAGDATRFEEANQGLLSGDYRTAAATIQAFGTGIDIPRLAIGIVTTPLAANRQLFGQVRGRFCRKGKESARLYYLWDRAYYGLRHLENLVRWNTRVLVLEKGEWVDAKVYIKSIRKFGM
jgi:superfamily II DNA or RNA helicase